MATLPTRVIYEPKGAALEYAPLAANLYRGCGHRCRYCYAPDVVQMTPEQFGDACARPGILEALERDARKLAGDPRPVLLCFTSDCYQPLEAEKQITRRALPILARNRLQVRVLTKNGPLAMRDLDLFVEHGVEYGTTLLFTDDRTRQEWEPNAAMVHERIEAIKTAHAAGVRTWLSMEPVIDPAQALALIRLLAPVVDTFKVGKLNHYPDIERGIDWTKFVRSALELLVGTGRDYYIKNDLWRHADPDTVATFAKSKGTPTKPVPQARPVAVEKQHGQPGLF